MSTPLEPELPRLRALDLSEAAERSAARALLSLGFAEELALAGLPYDADALSLDALQGDGERGLAAVVGAELVAVLTWTANERGVEPQRLTVAPAWRRRGLAAALFERMLSLETGAQAVWLEVAEVNTPARALYERLGLKAGPRRWVGPGLCLITLARAL